MNSEAGGMGFIANIFHQIQRIDDAAVHVVRVFKRDQRGLGVVINLFANLRLDQVPAEMAPRCGNRRGITPAMADIEASS